MNERPLSGGACAALNGRLWSPPPIARQLDNVPDYQFVRDFRAGYRMCRRARCRAPRLAVDIAYNARYPVPERAVRVACRLFANRLVPRLAGPHLRPTEENPLVAGQSGDHRSDRAVERARYASSAIERPPRAARLSIENIIFLTGRSIYNLCKMPRYTCTVEVCRGSGQA